MLLRNILNSTRFSKRRSGWISFTRPRQLANCRLVFTHIDIRNPLPADIRERLPGSAVVIQFPPLDLNLLWPLHAQDPRNVEEPDFPFGRFPYGDRVVIGLMRQGLAGQHLWSAYQEKSLAALPDLDRLRRMEEERLWARDAKSDIAVLPIIEEALTERPIFATINHPRGWLLGRMWGPLMEEARRRLGLSQPTEQITERIFKVWDPLNVVEMPLHPAVAEHFELKWWRPDLQYRYHSEMLRWEEFMQRYIDWR